jgi:hypothetical protein
VCGVLVFMSREIVPPGGQLCRREADAQVETAGRVVAMMLAWVRRSRCRSGDGAVVVLVVIGVLSASVEVREFRRPVSRCWVGTAWRSTCRTNVIQLHQSEPMYPPSSSDSGIKFLHPSVNSFTSTKYTRNPPCLHHRSSLCSNR